MENMMRVSLYITRSLNETFKDLKNKSKLNESKNIIITKCMIAGLKELYNIDIYKE